MKWKDKHLPHKIGIHEEEVEVLFEVAAMFIDFLLEELQHSVQQWSLRVAVVALRGSSRTTPGQRAVVL